MAVRIASRVAVQPSTRSPAARGAGQGDGPVQGDPAHQLGVQEVTGRAAAGVGQGEPGRLPGPEGEPGTGRGPVDRRRHRGRQHQHPGGAGAEGVAAVVAAHGQGVGQHGDPGRGGEWSPAPWSGPGTDGWPRTPRPAGPRDGRRRRPAAGRTRSARRSGGSTASPPSRPADQRGRAAVRQQGVVADREGAHRGSFPRLPTQARAAPDVSRPDASTGRNAGTLPPGAAADHHPAQRPVSRGRGRTGDHGATAVGEREVDFDLSLAAAWPGWSSSRTATAPTICSG